MQSILQSIYISVVCTFVRTGKNDDCNNSADTESVIQLYEQYLPLTQVNVKAI